MISNTGCVVKMILASVIFYFLVQLSYTVYCIQLTMLTNSSFRTCLSDEFLNVYNNQILMLCSVPFLHLNYSFLFTELFGCYAPDCVIR